MMNTVRVQHLEVVSEKYNIFGTVNDGKYVHSRKQKLAALYIKIARQAVQSSSEFYDFL
jgi:hypothetical protein